MWTTPEEINTHLALERQAGQAADTAVFKTNAILLCGARSVSGAIARAAAAHRGVFIVAGGVQICDPQILQAVGPEAYAANPHLREDVLSEEKEADYMYDVLVDECGVAAQRIIYLDRDSDSIGGNLKNVRHAVQNFQSLTLAGVFYTARRSLGTARMILGGAGPALTTLGVYPFGLTRETWPQSKLAGYVRQEAQKMDTNPDNKDSYIYQEFCIDPNVEAEWDRMKMDQPMQPRPTPGGTPQPG